MNVIVYGDTPGLVDLQRGWIVRDGYIFTIAAEPANVYDAILVRSPSNCNIFSPILPFSRHTLQEHIDYINTNAIEKAVIIADSLDFILSCPSLKYLRIFPSDTSGDRFDFSPLYKLPEVRLLNCRTVYGGVQEQYRSSIDYSNFKHLVSLDLTDAGHLNYLQSETLEELIIRSGKGFEGFGNSFCGARLRDLTVSMCGIRTLDGIEKASNLRFLCLERNRRLTDISSLAKLRSSLKALKIDLCPKIESFDVLSELEELEYLDLFGSNTIESLDFLNSLKKLKGFAFTINVLDGDLTPCKQIPHARCAQGRKHYNLRDSDLPKNWRKAP